MTRILITGVRGKTGAPLADLLVARGVEVLGGTGRPDALDVPGVLPTAFSWDDADTWTTALEGVDAIFVVRPDRPDAPGLIGDLVGQVPADARVVLLSEQDGGSGVLDRWAIRVEDVVRAGGRPWTILRPSWFMQVFTDERFLRTDVEAGRLPYPGGGASVAWIDARDIAAVAERALLDDDLDGQVLELTGPVALDLPATAQALTVALGRPVEHTELTIDEGAAGTEGFERDITVTTYERVRDGRFASLSDSVERVTGRPARPLEHLLRP